MISDLCFDRISDCAITGLETQGSMTIGIVAVADNQVLAAGLSPPNMSYHSPLTITTTIISNTLVTSLMSRDSYGWPAVRCTRCCGCAANSSRRHRSSSPARWESHGNHPFHTFHICTEHCYKERTIIVVQQNN